MQTNRYNGLAVKSSVYGINHVSFQHPDLPEGWLENASQWNGNSALFKCKGRRLIVAVKDGVIVDAEVWDKYGNEYKYAQQAIEDRHLT